LDSAFRGGSIVAEDVWRRVTGVVGEEERGDIDTGEEGTSAHSEDSEGNMTAFGL